MTRLRAKVIKEQSNDALFLGCKRVPLNVRGQSPNYSRSFYNDDVNYE